MEQSTPDSLQIDRDSANRCRQASASANAAGGFPELVVRFFVVAFMAAAFFMAFPVARDAPAAAWTMPGMSLLIVTMLLTVANLGHAMLEASFRDGLRLLVIAFVVGWGVEVLGVETGVPFGCIYEYSADFRPQLPGDIPLMIPLAWYVLIRLPIMLLRRWRVRSDGDANRLVVGQLLLKASVCGVFMAGCAFMLDPLGQYLGLWRFSQSAESVQNHNAFGWGVVGFLITAICLALRRDHRDRNSKAFDKFELQFLIFAAAFQLLALGTAASHLAKWKPVLASLALIIPVWMFGCLSRRKRGGSEESLVEQP